MVGVDPSLLIHSDPNTPPTKGPSSGNSRNLRASREFSEFRESPPELIKHMLTVLVFWLGVLVMPHLPSFIQEEPQTALLNQHLLSRQVEQILGSAAPQLPTKIGRLKNYQYQY